MTSQGMQDNLLKIWRRAVKIYQLAHVKPTYYFYRVVLVLELYK